MWHMNTLDKFKIEDRVVIITGGAGLLGRSHAEAVIDGGGRAILTDISQTAITNALGELRNRYGDEVKADGVVCDITNRKDAERVCQSILSKYGRIDALINNAANNPKVEGDAANMKPIQFENFPMELWNEDIAVGLTGAFICAQVFGTVMSKQGRGVILNISSDLGIIAPDQRIYRKAGLEEDEQNVKPVTYSAIKHALIGLTKYIATYWADKGVRSNVLCPGGVFNGQNDEFLAKLTNLIPMGRMADREEYKATILYLLSDASSYMTGSTLIVDGGRTCW